MRAALLRRFENQLREVEEALLPMVKIVRVLIDVPDVRHVLLLQICVKALADANQAILVTAGKIKELQLLLSVLGIRHEFRRGPGVRRGGEAADPREGVEVCEAEVQ